MCVSVSACVCVSLAPWGISFQWNVPLYSPLVAGGDAERSFDAICDVSPNPLNVTTQREVTQPPLLDSFRGSTVVQMMVLHNYCFLLSVIVLENNRFNWFGLWFYAGNRFYWFLSGFYCNTISLWFDLFLCSIVQNWFHCFPLCSVMCLIQRTRFWLVSIRAVYYGIMKLT